MTVSVGYDSATNAVFTIGSAICESCCLEAGSGCEFCDSVTPKYIYVRFAGLSDHDCRKSAYDPWCLKPYGISTLADHINGETITCTQSGINDCRWEGTLSGWSGCGVYRYDEYNQETEECSCTEPPDDTYPCLTNGLYITVIRRDTFCVAPSSECLDIWLYMDNTSGTYTVLRFRVGCETDECVDCTGTVTQAPIGLVTGGAIAVWSADACQEVTAYSILTAYLASDKVRYSGEGNSYCFICIQAHGPAPDYHLPNPAPGDNDYWHYLAD